MLKKTTIIAFAISFRNVATVTSLYSQFVALIIVIILLFANVIAALDFSLFFQDVISSIATVVVVDASVSTITSIVIIADEFMGASFRIAQIFAIRTIVKLYHFLYLHHLDFVMRTI
jgi:hypothetical protein